MKKTINRDSLSEQICDILKESIIKGKYKDGEKLPSEKELTEIYDVSRITIRAAIQRLNALGLVITKAGHGTYVNEFRIENYLNKVSHPAINSKTLDDIHDFRKVVDLECIRLAILNATDEELDKLKNVCADYEKISKDIFPMDDEKLKLIADGDYNMHLCICELSKNSLFNTVYLSIEEIIKSYLRTIIKMRYQHSIEQRDLNYFVEISHWHTNIYEYIKARDFEKAKKFFLNHIDYKVLVLPPEEFE